MNKPILVALDESPRAASVLQSAISLAHTWKTSLVLLRVIAMPAVQLSPEGLPTAIDLQTTLEDRAKVELAEQARAIPPDVPVKLVTILDVPWQGICDTAKSERVGLIVVGSHGHKLLDTLLGTTATKVVNHADRSVLVVRAEPVA
ncbi:MAG: universal stress protein [Polyangia bacterium]